MSQSDPAEQNDAGDDNEHAHNIDALDALASGRYAEESDAPPQEPSEESGESTPVLEAVAQPDEPVFAPEAFDPMAGLPAPGSAAPRQAHRRVQRAPNLAARRFAIPIMAAMALLMLAIGAWATLSLLGVIGHLHESKRPMAIAIAVAGYLVAMMMVLGCVVFWHDIQAAEKSARR
ncbi:MAG: hypothetical protein BIFFINMI_02643 [Phycisphaerae bacterium]|nr:hypothetical protein [Phycisphaerae bacterium]